MPGRKLLLVVGDWVVDENCLTGIHRSSTSLRTGNTHHRSLHVPNSPVQAFCGAGRLASILHRACDAASPDGPAFDIAGLGVWRYQKQGEAVVADDTDVLHSMFSFDFRKRQGPYALQSVALNKQELPNGVSLYNLAECLYGTGRHKDEHFSTTRVYRFFQRREDALVLLLRTDWEQPPIHRDTQGAPEWVLESDRQSVELFLRKNNLSSEQISGVIIKDLIKGVVTETLVSTLATQFKNVPWFVSTKRWNPPWLSTLSQVNLRLLLIPPIAANTALAGSADIDSWIAPAKPRPTRGAMKCLGSIEKNVVKLDNSYPVVAVSPTEGSILAKEGESFVVYQGAPPKGAPLVGWATAFFSALCASLVRQRKPLKSTIDFSLTFASQWAESEARFLQEPDLQLHVEPSRLTLSDTNEPMPGRVSGPESWQAEWDRWTAATATNGIIRPKEGEKSKPRLELWRSMTAVNGYVCFERDKRKELSRLANALRTFARKGIDQHEAVQLLSRPGSGKSHLVRCLAEASDLRMQGFNITHMSRREDIMSCFDTIVTTQASERDRPLLVFVDEINATIGGHPVYDAFLSPLEESVYVRGGCKFHIRPCVWVFAGTPDQSERKAAEKYVDFANRLTLGTIELVDISRLEKVYLGAQLVRRRFPDVRRISEEALEQFAVIGGSVRDLRNFVNKLRDVQSGEVSKANFPGQTAEPLEAYVDIE